CREAGGNGVGKIQPGQPQSSPGTTLTLRLKSRPGPLMNPRYMAVMSPTGPVHGSGGAEQSESTEGERQEEQLAWRRKTFVSVWLSLRVSGPQHWNQPFARAWNSTFRTTKSSYAIIAALLKRAVSLTGSARRGSSMFGLRNPSRCRTTGIWP